MSRILTHSLMDIVSDKSLLTKTKWDKGDALLSRLFAYVMGHLGRDDHGDFYHAEDLAVLAPRGLVNHFLDAVFVDGVAVDGVGGDHVADFLLRLLAMAGHEVLAQHGAALLVEGRARALVHENHFTFQVTHGDGTMGAFSPSQGLIDDILLVHFSLISNH